MANNQNTPNGNASAESQAKAAADAKAEDDAKALAELEAEEAAKKAAEAEAAATAAAKEAEAEREERDARLLARIEKLESEKTDREAEILELRSRLDGPKNTGPIVRLTSKAFNAEQSAKQLREIRPISDPRRQTILAMAPPTGKEFLVTPVGRNSGDLSPAIVSNCADEADAKAEYFKQTNAVAHKVSLKVEPHGDTKLEYEARAAAALQDAGQAARELEEFRAWKRQYQRRA